MRYTCENCHYYRYMDKEKDKKDCIMGQNTAKFYNDVTCCNYFIPIIEEEDQEEEPEEMPDKCPYMEGHIIINTGNFRYPEDESLFIQYWTEKDPDLVICPYSRYGCIYTCVLKKIES